MGGLRHLSEAGERVFCIQTRFNIGRDLQNDLVVSDQVVSNWHTSVEEHDGGFVVIDHNSLNGTFVQRGGAAPTRGITPAGVVFTATCHLPEEREQ